MAYRKFKVLYVTVDPVHIGAGGYRLGSVDMTISREPGTNLPKVPGTSLSGAARSYSAMLYGKPEAAGQHKKLLHRKDCPIIHTFGTTTDQDQGQAGTVSFADAHILFHPVSTLCGPFWVTTPATLARHGWSTSIVPNEKEKICLSDTKLKTINLGWLLFDQVTNGAKISPPASLDLKLEPFCSLWSEMSSRIAVVHEDLFAHLVNSNLEVRTSVSIDPATGAAEDKALFTYEAIPRAAWLCQDVIEDDYRGAFQKVERQFKRSLDDPKLSAERQGDPLGCVWETPWHVASAGLRMIEVLGVGGMGTRGFGRMRIASAWEEK